MHWEAVIERVWRCTWRPRSSALRGALCSREWASLEMQLETEIEWTQRCTWKLWSSEFGDALGGRGTQSLEMHFEAVMKGVWRCNQRPRLSELRDTLRGRDRASLEMHLWQAMIERGWRSNGRWSISRRSIWRRSMRGTPSAATLFLS